METRYFALVIGIVYVLIALLGFLPGFTAAPPAGAPDLAVDAGYSYLLGLFPINVLHNLVHLAVGAWGLVAYRSYSSARGFAKGLAVFYGVLTIMGVIPLLSTTFGLIPIFGHDIWLHALTAIIAAYFGFKAPVLAPTARQRERV
jgi:hypothetical protein